jgi:hypothetical protein
MVLNTFIFYFVAGSHGFIVGYISACNDPCGYVQLFLHMSCGYISACLPCLHTYLAADYLKEVDNAGLISPDSTLDYVACQTPPGLPSHTLTIKINGVYCLLE